MGGKVSQRPDRTRHFTPFQRQPKEKKKERMKKKSKDETMSQTHNAKGKTQTEEG